MTAKDGKRIGRKILASMRDLWQPTQIMVVRLTLLILLVSSLIPKIGGFIFENARVSNPVTIFIALLAFEILLEISRGSPTANQQTRVLQTHELTDDLREAFASKEVHLDILCYSAETVFGLLVPLFFDIRKMRVERIYIRILIRDLGKPFVVPCDRDGKEDADYRRNIVSRNTKIVAEFYSNVARVKRESPELHFAFEVRMHPFEPLQKGIVINRKKAYWCLYPIVGADRVLGGAKKMMWDYEGHSASLVELNVDRAGLSDELFKSVVNWFDTVWDNFSQPLNEDGSLIAS